MTLTALARDTAVVGLRLAQAMKTGVEFEQAPAFKPMPAEMTREPLRLRVDYEGTPAASPGESVAVTLTLVGTAGRPLSGSAVLELTCPPHWAASPTRARMFLQPGVEPSVRFTLSADTLSPTWAQGHRFLARLKQGDHVLCEERFGVAGSGLWKFLGMFYDALTPDTPDGAITKEQLLKKRGMIWRGYYVALNRAYINESQPDSQALFQRATRLLGRPAVVTCPTIRIEPQQVTGMCGEHCVYLAAELYSPDERDVHFWMGNNDAYRLWLNGKMVSEFAGQRWWTPVNAQAGVKLKAGKNDLLLKLINRGERIHFSFGVRQQKPTPDFPRRNDWCTDLAWGNPLADLR
jgi:hypothetical protein